MFISKTRALSSGAFQVIHPESIKSQVVNKLSDMNRYGNGLTRGGGTKLRNTHQVAPGPSRSPNKISECLDLICLHKVGREKKIETASKMFKCCFVLALCRIENWRSLYLDRQVFIFIRCSQIA